MSPATVLRHKVVVTVLQLAHAVPSLLHEDTLEFFGFTSGRLVPFILW